jgi:uncharacterized protein
MALYYNETGKPPRSARNRVRRHPERGRYDRETVESILDANFVGHLAFAAADGQPYAIPMLYVRDGDVLYLHGAPRSRLLSTAGAGRPVSFTVTEVNGLVLARAWFTHSINYRSAVLAGVARPVRGRPEKLEAMRRLVEHIAPGRADDARAPNETELKATEIVALAISEASAKVRAGGPKDVEADLDYPVWAGQVPVRVVADAPVAAEGCGRPVPGYVGALPNGRRG